MSRGLYRFPKKFLYDVICIILMSNLILTVRIDQEIRDWLNNQPYDFTISKIVRSLLHDYMSKQVGEKKNDRYPN